MSFPNIIYGDYGDEKVAQSTKIGNLPLGTLMILPDGRKFRHARAAASTAMTAGYLQQMPAVPSDTMIVQNLVPSATLAVGATSITLKTGGTSAIAKDDYMDGYLQASAGTAVAGVGVLYKIVGNNSAASGSTTVTIDLDRGDGLKNAAPAATALFGLRANQFNNLIIATGDTVYTGPIAGVPAVAVSAGFYCWIQRSGPASVYVAGSVLTAGAPIIASTGVSGAVALAIAGTASEKVLDHLGYGMSLGAASSFAFVNLGLE